MSKEKIRNVAIVLVLIALIYFAVYGNPFSLSINTYIPYSNFQSGVINPSEWTIQGKAFINPSNQLELYNQGQVGSNSDANVLTTQDLRGKKFRVDYQHSNGGVPLTLTLVNSDCCSTPICQKDLTGQRGSVELQPSILDDSIVLLQVDGIDVCTANISQPNKIQLHFDMSVGSFTAKASGFPSSTLYLSNPGIQLPVSCTLGQNDVTVFESFTPNTQFNVFSLKYPAKKMCNVLIQKPGAVIPDTNLEVAQLLAQGQSIDVAQTFGPSSIVMVLYTVDNTNTILPVYCTPSQVLANGQCQASNALFQVCSNGIFNANTLSCTVQANVICQGTTVIIGNQTLCQFVPPVAQPCIAGTLDPTTGNCQVPVYINNTVNCQAFGYSNDPNNPNVCLSYLATQQPFDLNIIVQALLLLAGIVLFVWFILKGIKALLILSIILFIIFAITLYVI